MTPLILACAGGAFIGALFGACAGVIAGLVFVRATPRIPARRDRRKPPSLEQT